MLTFLNTKNKNKNKPLLYRRHLSGSEVVVAKTAGKEILCLARNFS